MPGAISPSTRSALASRSMPDSSSVETIARRSAYRKPGAEGSRSSAITCNSRARAVASRPSWAGPGLALKDPPPPHLIFAVPRDGARETFLERRARPPAGQALHLVRGADVPVDLAGTLGDERLQRRRLPHRLEYRVRDVRDGNVDTRRHVQDLARHVLERRRDHGLDRL